MHKKLDLYFYGEIGAYDTLSPSYVSHRPYVPEILYLIAESEPYRLTQFGLANALGIETASVKEAIDSLLQINAVSERNGTYKLNFTVFLESDMTVLNCFLEGASQAMVSRIKACQATIEQHLDRLIHRDRFPKERVLYHILCDSIFDGQAFDYFDEKSYFKSSKAQPGGRDYLIYGFEDSTILAENSNKLLCSSNNYRSGGYEFNSFGDANGERKDWFRFFKCITKRLSQGSPFERANLDYIKLNEENNRILAESCGKFMDRVLTEPLTYEALEAPEKTYAELLIEFEYLAVHDGILEVIVPIFEKADDEAVNAISELVLDQVQAIVRDFFIQFENEMTGVTSTRHGVDVKEVAIELWHQLFGFTNEQLVKEGIVAEPSYIEGEGRYFRSFTREVL